MTSYDEEHPVGSGDQSPEVIANPYDSSLEDDIDFDPTSLTGRLGFFPHLLCLGLPPCFFAVLRSFPIFVRDPLRDSFVAVTIAAWQLVILFRMIRNRRAKTSRALESAVVAASVQQVIILVLASLVLDMGQAISHACVAGMAYWMLAGLILSARPSTPTATDVDLVRFTPFVFLIPICIAGMALELHRDEATQAILRSL
ncbi:MAG: hypothetical protein JW818_00680 [Pirellulales bacterium]|nr:hypothetical protein [Pirellulales bacterium]